MAVDDTLQLEVELPRAKAAPTMARSVLRFLCAHRVADDLLIDAELLISELATNALVHGEGDITLRAGLDEDRVWAEIVDQGGGFRRALRDRERAPEQIGGWGLGLVDVLASRWGVDDDARVWFELERQRAPTAEPRS
jgi:anti-sigma regulatory factor (Ser/Thr protein kinase)